MDGVVLGTAEDRGGNLRIFIAHCAISTNVGSENRKDRICRGDRIVDIESMEEGEERVCILV